MPSVSHSKVAKVTRKGAFMSFRTIENSAFKRSCPIQYVMAIWRRVDTRTEW